MASCILHNYLLDKKALPFIADSDAYVNDGTWRESSSGLGTLTRPTVGQNYGRNAKAMRDELRDWMSGVGAVTWQAEMVDYGRAHGVPN